MSKVCNHQLECARYHTPDIMMMQHIAQPSMKSSSQAGMVLLVTLAAMALLIPLVYTGMESQRFHLRQVQQELDLEIAHRRAESMLDKVMQILVKDGSQDRAVDHLNEEWAKSISLTGTENDTVEALLEDTARRWNLNAVKKPNGQINTELRTVLTRLFEREGISLELLESLTERLGPIDLTTEEQKPPTGNSPPMIAKPPLQAMEELLQIKGWNTVVLQKLQQFVTVNENCTNSRLNINTASSKTLEPLAPDQNWQHVEEIRKATPIMQLTNLGAVGVILAPEMASLLTVTSHCHVAHIRSRVNSSHGILTVWMVRNRTQVTITKTRWNG
ncbi:MAG: general secretion pathway protein GspK [Magnetococcus sp. DMHC-1]|nr:general secretion pathway protein GspK [Magnetococcales bacterium]